MINAESFRQKIKERIDKLTVQITDEVQSVLELELQKENVSIPCTITLNSLCSNNQDIVKIVLNLIGFSIVKIENVDDCIDVSIDFSEVKNKNNEYEKLVEHINKMHKIKYSDMNINCNDPYNYPSITNQPYPTYTPGYPYTGTAISGLRMNNSTP